MDDVSFIIMCALVGLFIGTVLLLIVLAILSFDPQVRDNPHLGRLAAKYYCFLHGHSADVIQWQMVGVPLRLLCRRCKRRMRYERIGARDRVWWPEK